MKNHPRKNEKLRQQRIERHWTLQHIANELGTAMITVQRWERGSQSPSLYYRGKLCALFGLTPQELGFEAEASSPASGQTTSEALDNVPEVTALWTVPYARNPNFTGRDDLLKELEQRLAAPGADQQGTIPQVALTQAQAMTGLGGIGKTQAAVEYAYWALAQQRYVHTLWITAVNEEMILASFASLAELLPTLNAREEADQRKLSAAVIAWLEQCQQSWLLIFDNADDLSLIPSYLPHRGPGSILLTTRASAVGSLASPIEVETMGVIEGTQLLLRRARRWEGASEEEINEATSLVVALGQLPLALDQAGAYIEETRCGVGEYLQLYEQHRLALLARRGHQSSGYPESVVTTWSLSFQRVEQSHPAAAELLRLCAFLAPDHIPEELFTAGAPYWPSQLQAAVTDRLALNQVLEVLLQFSLVKRLTKDRQVSIHRLVQAVQVKNIEAEEQRQWAERVVRAVNQIFPENPRANGTMWSQCLRYLEQAQRCGELIQQHQLQFPDAAKLLERMGIYLYEQGLYSLAEPLFLETLRLWERQGEPDHAHIVSSLTNLASIYRERGRYVEATPLFRQALFIHEHFVGQEDSTLAYLLQGLANLYVLQGKWGEAEELYQHERQIWERELGLEHPYVGYPLNSLAILYFYQGRYREAEPLYQRALHIWEHQLGPEHPHVAMVLSNLANLYYKQEQYEQAEKVHLRALSMKEKQLGPANPQMIGSLHGPGKTYQGQERSVQAEALYQQALSIGEQHLGAEHHKLFDPLNGLASLSLQQEQYARAEEYYQRAMQVLQQQVGPEQDHPHMVSPLAGLARLCTVQGKWREAEQLFQRALRIAEQQEQVNLEQATLLADFADFRKTQGQLSEAVSLYQQDLMIRESLLGPDHALTMETRTLLEAIQAELSRS